MPSVSYYNQTAPFWDFVASMEEQGTSHPLFGGNINTQNAEASDNENERPNHWAGAWGGFPWGPIPHRGRGGPHPPPPHHHEGPAPPPPAAAPEGESEPEAGPSDETRQQRGGRHGRRDHDHHHHPHGAWRGRHSMGGRGPHCRRGGRGHWNPYTMGGPFGGLADIFQTQFFNDATTGTRGGDRNNNNNDDDFTPEVDVFDAAEAFVVHVSLPGAKKEDIAVNWDAEKSELSISGVVHRPGDEELLKTISMEERKVGAFDRKVRLGSRANPAQVDVDAISARMEDGVLRVEVPKLDAGYVEIKKVDIE